MKEIFTRAGTGLVQSIVTMLNMIKKKWQVPSTGFLLEKNLRGAKDNRPLF